MDSSMVKAIADLAWPLIAAILFWRLYPLLKSVAQSRAFTIKVGQMEIEVQDAAEQLQDQIDDLRSKLSEVRDTLNKREIPPPEPATPSRRVLWVDDVPSNNAYAIAQLTEQGYEVLTALSTVEGMRVVSGSGRGVAAIVSDMGRREDGTFRFEAGLDLLRGLRKAGYPQPFLVCTTREAAQRYDQRVKEAGGSGATTSMVEVFEFIRSATAPA